MVDDVEFRTRATIVQTLFGMHLYQSVTPARQDERSRGKDQNKNENKTYNKIKEKKTKNKKEIL